MSPFKMLHNCGISSRLDFRKNSPIGVMWTLGLLRRWVATTGALTRMLRNFGILKILFPEPTRSDQYKTGPEEVSFTASATKIAGMQNATRSIALRSRSKRRFNVTVPRFGPLAPLDQSEISKLLLENKQTESLLENRSHSLLILGQLQFKRPFACVSSTSTKENRYRPLLETAEQLTAPEQHH
jgi:hypothetical protein